MTIRELLDELGIEYRLPGQSRHVTQGWVGIDCPSCSPGSGKFKLGINEGGWCSCWTCGSMRMIDVICQIKGGSLSADIVQKLNKSFSRDKMLVEKARGKYLGPVAVQHIGIPPGVGPTPWLLHCREYLEGRGFDPDQLGAIWEIGVLAAGIYIPIHYHGVVVTHTLRQLRMPGTVRYVSCPADREAVSAKDLLYGEDLCRGAIVIVEGPTDAWAIGPGAVATMGLSFSRAQVLKMSKHPLRVVCFDAEEQAQKKARELVALLSAFPGETVKVQLETGKDPGECDKSEILEIRRRFLDG